MIILNRPIDSLARDIQNVVEKLVGLETLVISTNFNESINYQNIQCLIVFGNKINLTNYSQHFTTIVEYEAQNINENFNSFNSSVEYFPYKKYVVKYTSTSIQIPIEAVQLSKEQQYDELDLIKNKEIILSTNIIETVPVLIELFEAKLKLVIYERDYLSLCKTYSLKFIEYADILINESTGIILIEPNFDLSFVLKRLNYLKYQLDFCYLIIIPFEKGKNSDNQNQRLNLMLQISKIEFLKIKLINVNNNEQLKEIIVKILVNDANKQIAKKTCLDVEAAFSEIVLISSCCFNSYSAQYMASKVSLNELLAMNINEIEDFYQYKELKAISFRIIKTFYQILNKSTSDATDRLNNNTQEVPYKSNKNFIFNKNFSNENDKLNKPQAGYKLTYERSNKQKNQTCLVFKKQ